MPLFQFVVIRVPSWLICSQPYPPILPLLPLYPNSFLPFFCPRPSSIVRPPHSVSCHPACPGVALCEAGCLLPKPPILPSLPLVLLSFVACVFPPSVPLCLCAFVATSQLCKTNPIPKTQNSCNILQTKDLRQFPAPFRSKKQTQTNPILRTEPEKNENPFELIGGPRIFLCEDNK